MEKSVTRVSSLGDAWLLDAHCDSFEMRHFFDHDFDLNNGEYEISDKVLERLKNIFGDGPDNFTPYSYQVTLPRLQQGNVKVMFMNVAFYDLYKSSQIIDGVYAFVEQYSDKFAICYDQQMVKDAVAAGKIAFVLISEGPILFKGQVDLLHNWHRLGLRVVI